MDDFFEIDFLDVESSKSGDAICVRYKDGEITTIHVVDGGYQETGKSVVSHINKYYDSPTKIDRVIVTHPDGDHAGGLRVVLEEFEVGELWMARPWLYAEDLIHRFTKYSNVENLKNRLKETYPNLHALEEIALEKEIPILEPFQGASIGKFRVLAPTKNRYLDLVVESDKTPESTTVDKATTTSGNFFAEAAKKAVNFIKSLWGDEKFSDQETSNENEMSVVQYANILDKKILLTGDAGRMALTEAADFAPSVGLKLPGIDRFQVPHHGSRRNVSTDLLNRWLGPILDEKLPDGEKKFSAVISAAKKDEHHPRKAVVRAIMHRGGSVVTTEGATISTGKNAPDRGWQTAKTLDYPEEQED